MNGDREKPGAEKTSDGDIFPGKPETSEEIRDLIVGPPPLSDIIAGRHPPSVSRPDVGRAAEISRQIQEILDNTELLQSLLSRTANIQEILVAMARRVDLGYQKDYVFSAASVDKSNPRTIDVSSRLNRLGRRGWFKKDTSTGTIEIEINGGQKINIEDLEKIDLDFLELSTIKITTESESKINYRLLSW